MSNDAKKVSQLSQVANVSITDRLVVLTNPSTLPGVQTVAIINIANTITSNLPIANSSVKGLSATGKNLTAANGVYSVSVTGPYANDSAANSAGVANGSLYYDSTGTVKIRLA
jgi:hypothetical protein